ncbi:peptidylprolyl isomerase [Shewanella gelidii]|uniref:Peptidyl-prolyl cis-trans isomerase n=1 Tax=Shewanella gelidii TaxID=1642821 RepID=A0A917JKD2_9GAMM|nr:peptidylprolyl isomerase [Shewanella gelidii]MCL1096640.1 peptidylprolyl isomerase [Shewanella gelidii]GGI69091.1 peptidyl-prolyl cis-trans isomerase [Shewanella gelidii]
MKITQNSAVSIHYRLSDDQGQQIENSFDGEPLLYLHGSENLIPGLEAELEGKEEGDKFDVTVAAENAYGPSHEGLIQEVPLEAFGDAEDLVPGMRFIAETEMGQRPVQITEIRDDVVVVDGNHPLAGKELSFSVEVVSVREATEEEVAHGHLHASEGGCCGGSGEKEGGCCGGGDHDHEHEKKEGCDGNGGCGCRE